MSAELLLEHLEYATKSPDAVPLLRRFILDMAVRGKLVSQNPKDEPATKLLERITKEKRKLEKEGVIKQEKPLSPIDEKDTRFQIPDGWKWIYLNTAARIFAGSSAPQGMEYFSQNGKPFFRTSDLGAEKRTLNLIKCKNSLSEKAIKELNLVEVKSGTVIFPKTGAAINTNNRGIIGRDGYLVTHLMAVEANAVTIPKWLFYVLCTIDMGEYSRSESYPTIKQSDVQKIEIPLPPLAEQKRIVAKVDKLMTLCDKLESSLTATQENRRRLLVSLLHADSLDGKLDATFKKKIG